MFKLLSTGNPKILKGIKSGYNTYILHLAPSTLSGYNTCPKASEGCKQACLNTAGRGGMFKAGENTNVIQKARIRKTKLFFEFKNDFMVQLYIDINKAIKQSAKLGLIPVFRLNGTSDIAWEKQGFTIGDTEYQNIFEAFPSVQFYDYTAMLNRKVKHIDNYQLTFSAKENNDSDIYKAIEQGLNIAVVFGVPNSTMLPESYYGLPVHNGDDSDLRFLDPSQCVIGLYAKGKAKKDSTGFVKSPVDNSKYWTNSNNFAKHSYIEQTLNFYRIAA